MIHNCLRTSSIQDLFEQLDFTPPSGPVCDEVSKWFFEMTYTKEKNLLSRLELLVKDWKNYEPNQLDILKDILKTEFKGSAKC